MAGVALLVVAALGCGWWAASALQSPAQREAAASPPAAQPVVARVEMGALRETVTMRCEVTPGVPATYPLTPASDPAVVTAVIAVAGQQVHPGDVLVTINGRPVFALPGAFGLYRDLQLGDSGPDVLQVQQGLIAAGYTITADSQFGPGTAAAIRQMYRDSGFTAPTVEVTVDSPAPTQSSTPDPTASAGTDTEPDSSGTTRTVQVAALPMAEVLSVQILPSQVTALPSVGTRDVAKLVVAFASGAASISAQAPATVATRLSPGMDVEVAGPGDTTLAATIGDVAPAADAETPDESSGGAVVQFALAQGGAVPAQWVGTTVVATVDIQRVADDALLVPTRAVAMDSQGTARVLVRQEDGMFTPVPVTELGSYAGTSAVQPAEAGALEVGDQVRVDG